MVATPLLHWKHAELLFRRRHSDVAIVRLQLMMLWARGGEMSRPSGKLPSIRGHRPRSNNSLSLSNWQQGRRRASAMHISINIGKQGADRRPEPIRPCVRGVGRSFHGLSNGRAAGLPHAAIDLDKARPDALRFYETLGFVASHED
jgi:hypothetical protein